MQHPIHICMMMGHDYEWTDDQKKKTDAQLSSQGCISNTHLISNAIPRYRWFWEGKTTTARPTNTFFFYLFFFQHFACARYPRTIFSLFSTNTSSVIILLVEGGAVLGVVVGGSYKTEEKTRKGAHAISRAQGHCSKRYTQNTIIRDNGVGRRLRVVGGQPGWRFWDFVEWHMCIHERWPSGIKCIGPSIPYHGVYPTRYKYNLDGYASSRSSLAAAGKDLFDGGFHHTRKSTLLYGVS